MSSAADVVFDLSGGVQSHNTAHKSGGSTAFLNFGDSSDAVAVNVDGVPFLNNTSDRSGAGLVLQMVAGGLGQGALAVSGCVFEGNAARANGGRTVDGLQRG